MAGTGATPTLLLLFVVSFAFADDVVKDTRLGRMRGNRIRVLDHTVEEYRGIPYAEPPLGRLRFKPPKPVKPWEGILDARTRRTACPQVLFNAAEFADIEHTEDCLHLNVWSPQESTKDTVPVLAWIHGGGFMQGSSGQSIYNGSILAARTGLVVVTLNYRLGFLGFLDAQSPEAPGNVGLMDQSMALKWIRDNIEQFGGDPSKVTIVGASAGGMSVHAHLMSPMSKGLFLRAGLMSGTLHGRDFIQTANESISKGNIVATAVGCADRYKNLTTSPESVIDCLRSKSAFQIARSASSMFRPKLWPFIPTYHNEFLPVEPAMAVILGLFNTADLLIGVTADEGAVALRSLPNNLDNLDRNQLERSLRASVLPWLKTNFSTPLQVYTAEAGDKASLRRSYADYLSDSVFVCPMHFVAEEYSIHALSVYSYVFGHLSRKDAYPSWMGTLHYRDVPYLFGVPLVDRQRYDSRDGDMSDVEMAAFSTFASTGMPQHTGRQPWPKYTSANPFSVYLSGGNTSVIHGFHMEKCNIWKSFRNI